jgi:hypothetical protein
LQGIRFVDPKVKEHLVPAFRAGGALPLLLDICRCEASTRRAEESAGGMLANCGFRVENARKVLNMVEHQLPNLVIRQLCETDVQRTRRE